MREINLRRFFIVTAVFVIGEGAFLGYRAWNPGSIRGSFDIGDRSVRIEDGQRLRIAIAGHDASTFARYPEDGAPVLTFMHSPASPSFLELPVASD